MKPIINKETLPPILFNHVSNTIVTSSASLDTIENILKQITQLLQIEAAQCILNQSLSQQKQVVQHGLPVVLQDKGWAESLPTDSSHTFIPIKNLTTLEGGEYQLLTSAGFRTFMQRPICSMDDAEQIIGSLLLLHTAAYQLTEKDYAILEILTGQISLHVKNRKLTTSEESARLQAKALQEVSIALTSNLNIESLFNILLEQIVRVVPSDVANLGLVSNGRIIIVQIIGTPPYLTPLEEATHMSIEETPLLKEAISTARPLLVQDTLLYDKWIWVPESQYVRSWIGIPIYVNQKLEAFISLHKAEPNFYTPQQLPILEAFQSQAAVAIHNARLFEKSSRQARELQILNQVSRDLTAVVTVQDICHVVANCLHQDFGYFYAAVYLNIPPENTYVLQGQAGQYAKNRSLNEEIQKLGHNSESSLFQTRTTQSYQFELTAAEKSKGTCSLIQGLLIPLKMSESVTGLLCIESQEHTQQTEQVSELILHTLCDQLVTAIEKMRLFENISRYAQEVETLYHVSFELRELATVADVLSCAIQRCVREVQATGGGIMLLESESGDLILQASEPPFKASSQIRYRKGQGIVHHVAATKEIYVAENVQTDPLTYIPSNDIARLATVQSSISLPILTEGRLVGVLNIWYNQHHHFTKDEQRILTALTEIISGALERANVLETLEQRVHERTQELEEANKQLQELDDLKSRFVSEVSHELRTPIANLRLYVDLLKRGKNRPEKYDKYIDVLGKQAMRLENLVESVLYLSRLDLGQGRFELVPVDVNEVIEEVLTTQVLRADTKGLVLTYEATKYSTPSNMWSGISRPLKVLGDRNQLAQLVTALVDNAINYTDTGFVEVRMYMDGSKEVCIEVADSGVGIPTREWNYLFKRFYRGEMTSQSNIPGNGLGLAIAKEITAIHRGRIDLQSKVGGGTTFLVWLPIIAF